ncbi:MAG: prepilin-type N-terminal cleavage/methylation domain-containing protein, partial [Planctomycetes bacterium]|nr:prepilin-type N-terminal cleavage/methylation domain-containing protein [Planctomycetota bacterium]
MPHPIDRRAAANRPAQAFTLIEVLVVVAIIAVLVAILLPALSAARQQTRRVLCVSNLHTWANAFQTYAGAFGGYIPRDYGGQQYLYVSSGDRWHVLAPEVMSPYLGGPKLPLVPRDQDPFVTKPFDQLTTNKDADDRDLFLAPIFLKMPSLQCPSFPAGTLSESLPTG